MSWDDLQNEIGELFDVLSSCLDTRDIYRPNDERGVLHVQHGVFARVSTIQTRPASSRPYLDPAQRKAHNKSVKLAWRSRTDFYRKDYARNRDRYLNYRREAYQAMPEEVRKEHNRQHRQNRNQAAIREGNARWYAKLCPEKKQAKLQSTNERRRERKAAARLGISVEQYRRSVCSGS